MPDSALYHQRMESFFQRLTVTMSSWYIVRRLREFPGALVLLPDDLVLYRLIEHNFTVRVVLDLGIFLGDSHRDAFTLYGMRDWMLQQCCVAMRPALRQGLSVAIPAGDEEDLVARARALRDRVLAHHDRRGLPPNIEDLSYEEADSLVAAAQRAFDALVLRGKTELLYHVYLLPQIGNGESDVDAYLRHLGERSLLKLPEEYLFDYAILMPEEIVEQGGIYNRWRRWLGYYEVDFEEVRWERQAREQSGRTVPP